MLYFFFPSFIFLIFITSTINAAAALCPEGTVEWKNKCYFFQANLLDFLTAEADCRSLGGHLASVHDGFTNFSLTNQSMKHFDENSAADFWIGLSNLNSQWTWTDQSIIDFKDWDINEPPQNITNKKCVALSLKGGRWKTDDCLNGKSFVCEVDKSNFEIISTTPPPLKKCDFPFIYFAKTNACYGFGNWTTGQMTFWSAEEYCNGYGGYLTSVHNNEEMEFIKSLTYIANGTFWMGGWFNDVEWKWQDGTKWDYNAWSSGYPTEIYLQCTRSNSEGMLNRPCFESMNFALCKIV